MNLCQTCWTRFGRSLADSDCLCLPNTSVLNSSQFHAWNATRLEPLPERQPEAPKPVYVQSKQMLIFGEKQEKKGKK
jgi:hypothetical protein